MKEVYTLKRSLERKRQINFIDTLFALYSNTDNNSIVDRQSLLICPDQRLAKTENSKPRPGEC